VTAENNKGFQGNLESKISTPAKRLAVTAIDQIASTASNFLVVIAALFSLPTAEFGQFSFAWGALATFIALNRSLFSTPIVLDNSGNKSNHEKDASSGLTGSLLMGFFTILIVIPLVAIEPEFQSSSSWLLLLVLSAPLILLQDQLRYFYVSVGKPQKALTSDLVIFGILTGATLLTLSNYMSSRILIASFIVSLTLSSTYLLRGLALSLSISSLVKVLKDDFHRRSRLIGEALATWIIGLAMLVLMRASIGNSGIAIYSALGVAFAPVTLIAVFMSIGIQGEVNRLRNKVTAKQKIILIGISVSPILWAPFLLGILNLNLNFFKLFDKFGDDINNLVNLFALAAALYLLLETLNLFMRAYQEFGKILIIKLLQGVLVITMFLIATFRNASLLELLIVLCAATSLGIIATLFSLWKVRTDPIESTCIV